MDNDPWAEFNPQAPSGGGGLEAVPLPSKPPAPKDPLVQEGLRLRNEAMRRDLNKPLAATGGMSAAARAQAMAKLSASRQLRKQLDIVEGLFNQGIGKGRSLQDFVPTPTNKAFDAAVAGLMPLARQTFRVPGSGADSDKELQIIQDIMPNRWSFDEANRQRFDQLRSMIDAVEEQYGPLIGGKGAPNLGKKPAPKAKPRVLDFNDLPE